MIELRNWSDSFYRFENGDGTMYSIHMMPCVYGGIYAIVNDESLYLWFENNEVRLLIGKENKYTTKAVLQIMKFHFDNRVDANES